ncbi:phage tail assembly protein [Psychromonas aquimarina]|uniref:phage tail assembly protein n=1 Tax=Psychromonas aquimarina TaxID=444919 RepID=UPI00048F2D93|nr:phage tail assembly protein [Psychromonas aquimarina]
MNKATKTAVLAQPIEIEEGKAITEVTLRKPFAGEMRGLSFSKIMEFDVDTMVTLVPRISELSERQMINLEPVNMPPLFTGVASFFVHIDSPNE